MGRDSLIADRLDGAPDIFPGDGVVRVRIVFQQTLAKFGAMGIRELQRVGFVRIDAIPDFFDQCESLLDVELVQPKSF